MHLFYLNKNQIKFKNAPSSKHRKNFNQNTSIKQYQLAELERF